tara:strand:- start:238 stop:1254 length:1017 start_codon:yes stop_codon:yes gene_type:complete
MGSIFKSKKAKPAQPMQGVKFKPYTYTSSVGTTTGTPSGDAFNVTRTLDPQLVDLQQGAIGYAQPFLTSYLEGSKQGIPEFSFGETGEQRARDIFAEQSALLEPQFAQQRQQLKSDLFGSGRMGLMLAGETTGAGGGYVQPDAFGLARAQSKTLADLSGEARERAMGEQQQAFEQAAQGYDINRIASDQALSRLLSGFTGAFGAYGSVADLESGLVNQGLAIEQARSAAQQGSAQAGAALAQAGTPAKNSFFSDLVMESAKAYAASKSDKKLKTNIRKVGQLASGLNTYFWDWTEEAKKLVGNQMTFGVIAQEAIEVFPEAISKDSNGYLQVDYARIR